MHLLSYVYIILTGFREKNQSIVSKQAQCHNKMCFHVKRYAILFVFGHQV